MVCIQSNLFNKQALSNKEINTLRDKLSDDFIGSQNWMTQRKY